MASSSSNEGKAKSHKSKDKDKGKGKTIDHGASTLSKMADRVIKSDAAEVFRRYPRDPVRILVRTATHLVPGEDFVERTGFIKDVICRHVWERDFDHGLDRFHSYHATFAFDNRTCYFLIDHGKCRTGQADEDVTVLRYSWDGKTLDPIHGHVPSRVRRKLKSVSFTPKPERDPRPGYTRTQRLERIRFKLQSAMKLTPDDFVFLENNDKRMVWMRQNLEPKLLPILMEQQEAWFVGQLKHTFTVSWRTCDSISAKGRAVEQSVH